MKNPQIVLLSSTYLAPIQYYTKIISYSYVIIERCESYQKQTYRNRCIIQAANGPLVLSIPVTGGPEAKCSMQEIRVSYDYNWQQLHWRGIISAYKNSPFFDYYSDDLAPFYHTKKWNFLFDFNNEIQDVILNAIEFNPVINFTESYEKSGDINIEIKDFRYTIHPKLQRQASDEDFVPIPYTQVFNAKFDFQPNLSILDLLFNEGPQTLNLLRSCVRTATPL